MVIWGLQKACTSTYESNFFGKRRGEREKEEGRKKKGEVTFMHKTLEVKKTEQRVLLKKYKEYKNLKI